MQLAGKPMEKQASRLDWHTPCMCVTCTRTPHLPHSTVQGIVAIRLSPGLQLSVISALKCTRKSSRQKSNELINEFNSMRIGAWHAPRPSLRRGWVPAPPPSTVQQIQSEICTIRWSNAKCKLLPGANYRKRRVEIGEKCTAEVGGAVESVEICTAAGTENWKLLNFWNGLCAVRNL